MAMGPVIVCDKSTLQALSRDELSALRRYYIINIPPVLLVEILADLRKRADPVASREEVRVLANKLVPACSCVNTDYRKLIRAELAGHRFPMDGRPVLTGGQHVVAPEGKKGVIFETSEEAKALLRWQTGDFHAAESLMAETWRLSNRVVDLEAMQRQLRGAYSGRINLGTLSATAEFVDTLINSGQPRQLVEWFLRDAGLITDSAPETVQKLQGAAPGSLTQLFPYTSFCIRVALIFHFALAFGLVSTRPTNRIDLEYLYYAPFGNAFSSGDTLHRKTASLVLRGQTYVERDELKTDLAQLAAWWAGLTDEQRADEKRVSGPPENGASVTHRLWKKVMRPGYRDPNSPGRKLSKETSAKLFQKYQELIRTKLQEGLPPSGPTEDYDFMMVKHEVRLDGPCICGSEKRFKECCGRQLAKSQRRENQV